MRSSTVKKEEIRAGSNARIKLDKNTLYEIGSILKEAREKRLLKIKDIRTITCIPTHHLIAIESGQREELPEDFFLIGFIKKYSRAVGLNEDKVLDRLIPLTSPNYDQRAFDLLFQNDKTRTNRFRQPEQTIFKVYHFYFLIGLILFGVVCYLSAGSYSMKSNFKDRGEIKSESVVNEPNINYENIESWVSEEKPALAVKTKSVTLPAVIKIKKINQRNQTIAVKPKANLAPQKSKNHISNASLMLRPPVKLNPV